MNYFFAVIIQIMAFYILQQEKRYEFEKVFASICCGILEAIVYLLLTRV